MTWFQILLLVCVEVIWVMALMAGAVWLLLTKPMIVIALALVVIALALVTQNREA